MMRNPFVLVRIHLYLSVVESGIILISVALYDIRQVTTYIPITVQTHWYKVIAKLMNAILHKTHIGIG